ncbi:MAG: formylglycine-generating enzyme family protein [Planctomycetota bacterium]
MDQRQRRLEREVGQELEGEAQRLAGRARGGDPYAEACLRALELEGFAYEGMQTFACGGQSFPIARFQHEQTGLVFCLIPGGTSLLGSPGGQGRDNEYPQHEVAVPPFLLADTPCTQAAWTQLGLENPSHFKGANRPVEKVSWDDAQGFCEKAGLRLPSEAEWEFACRAGTQTAYCFGDGEAELGRYAEFEGNNNSETKDVGGKLPNAFGLFDVHGNVLEWCQDVWHDGYRGAASDGSAWNSAGAFRINRGGSWYEDAWNCRSANRNWDLPAFRRYYLGFRPARSLP